MDKLYGGYPIYGADIGILMLNCCFPRPRGDIGNANTFSYPVCYELIKDTMPTTLTIDEESESVEHMLHYAEELERKGVRAILTSCGLLIAHQDKLVQRLSVPVASSSLTLLPFVQTILGPDKKIGIIVSALNTSIQKLLDISENKNVVPISMEASPEFMRGIMSMSPPFELDQDRLRDEVVEICQHHIQEHGQLSAIIVECTNIAPYSSELRRQLRIPVFDITQVADLLHAAVSTD